MLKVLPIQSKLRQEEICIKCGIVYNPDLLAYAVSVDEQLVGICQFRLTDKGGEIHDIASVENAENAFEPLFVMGRGTLNFMDLHGVHTASFCGKQPDDRLLRAIGFVPDSDGIYRIDLEGFFTDHCHQHSDSSHS